MNTHNCYSCSHHVAEFKHEGRMEWEFCNLINAWRSVPSEYCPCWSDKIENGNHEESTSVKRIIIVEE